MDGLFSSGGYFSLEGGETLPQTVITFPGAMRSYTVKDNDIAVAVSEILRYK